MKCLLYVDFAICNDFGKNKMGTEADLIKQSCWAEAEAAEGGQNNQHKALRNYRGITVTACIVSVKPKIFVTLREAGGHIYSNEILLRIAKLRDCLSKVGENSLLNEFPKR